jgi:uncharacterized membrane protein
MATEQSTSDGIAGPVLTGLTFGALLDGVVFHQVLQWHHVWSGRHTDETLAGLRYNVFIDGVFQLAVVVLLAVAVALLTRTRAPWPTIVGGVLLGWGLFNVADQLVFHLALHAHHIREDVADPAVWDWSFFAAGVAMTVIGGLIVVRARQRTAPADSP